LFDAPIQLEEAASKINDVMDAIVELASLLAAIRELLEVISLKRRQINRIRFKIVPQLDSTIDYIEYILEEIEQQDAIRVRVLQRKRKERSEKSDETSSL
jgi:vacuolar-type H+-ATPase subunit D/Vma8